MDEIIKLQEALRQAQAIDSVHRLSEFNCVELVTKLINAGMLDILFTTNGKEYITWQQLEREIKDEVLTAGGRINLVDIPQILNVDLPHIEKAANELVKKDGEFMLIAGEIIASYYMDDLAVEIDEVLAEQGSIELTALAKKYNFTTQYMTQFITQRLGNQIHGRISANTLYTKASVLRHVALTRGAFTAATRPVRVSDMCIYGLQEALAAEQVKDLISHKSVDALLRGQKGDSLFVPNIFLRKQREAIESFYKANSRIEYTTVEKLQVQSDPKSYLKSMFPDGIALETVFVHPNLIANADASCEEALSSDCWIDLETMFPSSFSNGDVSRAVLLLPSVTRGLKGGALVLGDRFVVSQGYIAKAMEHFKNDALERARAAFVQSKQGSTGVPQSSTPGQPTHSGKSKEALQMDADEEADDDDDWNTNKKKGKGAKQKKVAPPPAKAKAPAEQKGKGRGKGEESERGDVTADEVAGQLMALDAQAEQSMIALLAEELIAQVSELRRSAKQTVFSAAVTSTRAQQEEIIKRITEKFLDLQAYAKGAAVFKEDDKDSIIFKHIIKTVCSDLTNLLVELEVLVCLPEPLKILDAAGRDQAVKQLPADVRSVVATPIEKLKAKELDSFLESFEAAAKDCNVMLRPADKKTMRNHMFNIRHTLYEALESEKNPSTAATLIVSCQLLFANAFGAAVTGPGRIIPMIIAKLEGKMDEDSRKVLSECYDLMVKQLSCAEGEFSLALAQKLESSVARSRQLALNKDTVKEAV